ncbi:MAG TPA: SulP family inorganic anion transporter [Thermomicrobiales bacterium]|nr:SulP family inorganic anion transporter [Thermomicrobiales bacterium]
MRLKIEPPALWRIWRTEFAGYNRAHFQLDLTAGLTVAAVALPLALAFGVASGSTAAAGLVTAIIAGFLIGALSGAPYQISGPTGAMSAVLLVVAQRHGLQGLWVAGLMAGLMILALGLFRLGRIINFIPAPVITGFTSGIALIIAIGQIDNALGIQTEAEESAALKLINYFRIPLPDINTHAVISTIIVALIMFLLPRVPGLARVPTALVGISVVTAMAWSLGWPVATIGEIPRSIILNDRMSLDMIDPTLMRDLLVPAISIAALGAIESLLAGVVAGRMTGTKLNVNQELIAQGAGNIAMPFFGGVPATAAIARISVGVRAGGVTRLVSVTHSVALLAGALFLGSVIARIPMAALAGVLIVTAWRMNEWHVIHFYINRRLDNAVVVMLVTMVATVALDLTQAILIGVAISLLVFLAKVSRLTVVPTEVDWDRLRAAGFRIDREVEGMQVVYVTGSLYFGAIVQFIEAMESLPPAKVLILSMRGVPLVDVSSVHAFERLAYQQRRAGGRLLISGLQPQVRDKFERAGLVEEIGEDAFFWSADQAILKASNNGILNDSEPGTPPGDPLTAAPVTP